MALSLSHNESSASSEKCLLSDVTIIGPSVLDNSEENFTQFTESYTIKLLHTKNDQKWLKQDSLMLKHQT